MKKKITFTKEQEDAIKKIEEWFLNSDSQLFVIAGYAGTGKTFIIQHIIKKLNLEIDKDVAFITPTGKSAEVLVERGISAQTLHRLIYTAVEVEETENIDGEAITRKKVEFVKKKTLPKTFSLLVVDEFSMVSDDMIRDLKSFGIKILAAGDPGQLPPINGFNSSFKKPDAILTEIVRQSLDNPIVALATDVRNNKKIIASNYDTNHVVFLKKDQLSEEDLKELYFSADQILVGKNDTKNEIDNQYRKFKGIDPDKKPLPLAGEKIIALVNNWEQYMDLDKNFSLVNGTIGEVYEDSRIANNTLGLATLRMKPDYKCRPNKEALLFDANIFKKGSFSFDMHQKALLLADGSYYIKRFQPRKKEESNADFRKRCAHYALAARNAIDETQINRFQFAYAITGHKSQGSEWKNVIIVDESNIFGKDKNRWLYTCITRAKEKVTILI